MKEIDKSSVIRNKLAKSHSSPLKVYKELTIGNVKFSKFLYYEIVTSLFGLLPGGLGFFLRKKFYPKMFKKVGRGLIIGRNVTIRHPQNIIFGDFVTIDDNCILDGRGGEGILFEDNVLINRNCMILAKAGSIIFGKRTSLGGNSAVVSMSGVELGEAVLTAGGCAISTGLYSFDDIDKPIMDQKVYSKGPIKIGDFSWIGTNVTIVDGVKIGKGVVIGALSLVNKDIEDYAIAVGIPAKVIRIRNNNVTN